MSKEFFPDYNRCKVCSFDHEYDREESLARHIKFLAEESRRIIMEQNNTESFSIQQDPQAYAFFGASMVLVAGIIGTIIYMFI